MMDRVLVYSKSLDPQIIGSALAAQELKTVSTKHELAEAIFNEENLLCVLIEWDRLEPELKQFLESLKKSFPVLKIGFITPPQEAQLPEGYRHIDSNLGLETLRKEVREFVSSIKVTNRRESHRFDWPLQGYLSLDQENWQSYLIRSLSAGGAFLECDTSPPEPGSAGLLRIVFQDFKMLASCDILDPRQASSNLPFGFGVRFVDLSAPAARVIDRIIHDALVQTLLAPESEPKAPSIGDEELLTDNFELL